MLEKKSILVVGSGGHSKVVTDVIENEGVYTVAGILDPYKNVGDLINGYSVVGSEEDIVRIREEMSIYGVIVAVGDNFKRSLISGKIKKIDPGIEFISTVHSSAVLGKRVAIGEGTVVMGGACINSDVKVGGGCIINTTASIDHDCSIGDFSSLGPGVVTGGNVEIGECTAIGIGAVLSHSISVGDHVVVGAGSIVLKAIESQVVAYGVPAKFVRTRAMGDQYLT